MISMHSHDISSSLAGERKVDLNRNECVLQFCRYLLKLKYEMSNIKKKFCSKSTEGLN